VYRTGRPGSVPPADWRAVRPLWAVWTAATGLLLVVVCGLVARGGVPGWERLVFRAVNGLPGWLYRPMWLLQLLGVLGSPVLLAILALLSRTLVRTTRST
jgi:hypothetical protein